MNDGDPIRHAMLRPQPSSRRPRRHAGEHDLIEAFDRPGCPVCLLAGEAVEGYLASVCYEQVNDLELRERLRGAGGFCGLHAWAFLRQRNGPLASAIVQRDVLATAAGRIRRGGRGRAERRAGGSLLARLFGSRGPARGRPGGDVPDCPACQARAEAEARHLDVLLARLTDPGVQARYGAADGLCLPHLDKALEAGGPGADVLADAAGAGLDALVDRLDGYIRKHDYRFRPETWQGDDDTAERAVERAVGRHA